MRTGLVAFALACIALTQVPDRGNASRTLRLNLPVAPFAPAAADEDHDAIRSVVQQYMTFDPARLLAAFCPTANLYTASEQGELRTIPFAQFLENVTKGAAAGRPVPKMQIDLIDHQGNAAVAKVTEHSDEATVTDYLSLVRGSSGWKVVSKTFFVERHQKAAAASNKAETPACTAGDVNSFSYMAGDWTTSDSPVPAAGAVTGSSRTEVILDGCALWEHRRMEQNGKELFDAHVVLGYDVTTKRTLLFYVDNRAHMQLYEGRQENGRTSFYRERPDPDGTMVLVRVSYSPQGKGFTQTVERSRDKGATWQPGGVTLYEPNH